jgi:hypothetical protein
MHLHVPINKFVRTYAQTHTHMHTCMYNRDGSRTSSRTAMVPEPNTLRDCQAVGQTLTKAHSHGVMDIRCDGTLLVRGCGKSIKVWGLAHRQTLTETEHCGTVCCAKISPDGTKIASAVLYLLHKELFLQHRVTGSELAQYIYKYIYIYMTIKCLISQTSKLRPVRE